MSGTFERNDALCSWWTIVSVCRQHAGGQGSLTNCLEDAEFQHNELFLMDVWTFRMHVCRGSASCRVVLHALACLVISGAPICWRAVTAALEYVGRSALHAHAASHVAHPRCEQHVL